MPLEKKIMLFVAVAVAIINFLFWVFFRTQSIFRFLFSVVSLRSNFLSVCHLSSSHVRGSVQNGKFLQRFCDFYYKFQLMW